MKPKIIAFIPARSGSKSIKDKNIKILNGKPLIAWSIQACLKSKFINKVVISTDSKKYAKIAKKYGVNSNSNSVNKQNEAFAKILGDDEELPKSVQSPREEVQRVEVRRDEPQQYIQSKVEDPIITMFKNVKRVKEFSISLEIKNKIPRPDFIEMMEDSYNTSIIDFLAAEFTDNLLKNPHLIEDMIKQKIKEVVYGVEVGVKDVNSQITDSVTQVEKHEPLTWEKEPVLSKDLPKKTRKPRAKKEISE